MTRRKPRKSHNEAIRKAWLQQAVRWPDEPWPAYDDTPNHVANSNRPGHQQRTPPHAEGYAENVARPAMEAVDGLPKPYRDACNAYGFVDVYRAWLRRIPPDKIAAKAERLGGVYVL